MVSSKVDRITLKTREEDSGYSWNFIPSYKQIQIPKFQQMVVVGEMDIEGPLDVQGELVLLDG